MRQPQPEDLAYMAGFFDGEGTVQVIVNTKYKKKTIRVSISQKDISPLIWINEFFPGNMFGDTSPGVTRIVIQGRRAVDFLQGVLPYLIVKKESAEYVLKCWEARLDDKDGTTMKALWDARPWKK